MPSASKILSAITKGLFLPVCLILVLQAAASRVLYVTERDLALPGLHQLPVEFGTWKAPGEQTLETSVAEYLKPDEYILRDYTSKSADSSVNLFVAYFKSLQNAYGPHSPRVCLPGSGWLVRSSQIATLPLPGRPEGIPVNEYRMEKSDTHILVMYWYQNERNIWAEEFRAKLTMLPDLIRYRRSDASLVRLVTPLRSADGGKELENCREFARSMFPVLVEHFKATR